jgi:hypothetical protein
MIARGGVRQTPRSESTKSLIKALEFAEEARAALAAERWNASGLASIHSGICAADAALIASAGVRSISQDHGAVIALLEVQVPEFAAAQRRQLTGLLRLKTAVSYEQRLVTEIEARQLAENAERLSTWARRVVEAHEG